MARYYFYGDTSGDGSDRCYTKDFIKGQMKEQGWVELDVVVAEMDRGLGVFYCSEFDECGESGEGCGIDCSAYAPRNGKNGRCKFHKNTYSPSDQRETIKL